MADIRSKLAAGIRGERAVQRWSQAELAQRLGVVQRTVSEMESGRRPIDITELVTICRVFAVPLATLLRTADREDLDPLGL